MDGMSLQEKEDVAAAHATAPRVSLDDVKANITKFVFKTADQLLDVPESAPESFKLLTLCVAELKNGFTVVGKSACVSPENFDKELGERIAFDDVIQQVWPLMGYALREELSRVEDGEADKLEAEAARLANDVAAAKAAD
jgi:hypothetical protein